MTRRIYRSGEGEYLINHQPCRLRDIRDLFAGTGIATDAYSIIEQGKVDVMLQSSPKDRRAIFEEAAGISRFKAKKIEASRRLERVEQNMLRLSDIVDEVENRLRTIRSQATKARRYKEHTDRLQELRTQVGMADWRALTDHIDTFEKALQSLRCQRDEAHAGLEAIEAKSLGLETEISKHDEAIRAIEARNAQQRERIATTEATIEHEQTRSGDLEGESERHRRQLAAMQVRAGDLEQQLRETSTALEKAEREHSDVSSDLDREQADLKQITDRLAELRPSSETRRTAHIDQMRTASELGNRISALQSQQASASAAQKRCEKQLSELALRQKTLESQSEQSRSEQEKLENEYERCTACLHGSQAELAQLRRDLSRHQKEVAQLQGRHTGALQRSEVLEELERRLEGLSAGVKQVLVKTQQSSGQGPFRQVRGLVADLLHVNVETAPLIEAALGDRTQYLVIAPGRDLIDHLADESTQFDGRVGFLRTDVPLPASPVDRIDLEGQPGVVSRADKVVETTAEFVPLVRRLLSRVWIVETLGHALTLSESNGRGLTFVTLSGQRVSPDGTVLVGPKQSSTGLISRRSELRALRQQIEELATDISSREAFVGQLEEQIGQAEQQVQQHSAQHERLSGVLAEQRLKTASSEDRLEQLTQQRRTLEDESRAAAAQSGRAAQEIGQSQQQLTDTESQLADLARQIEQDAAELETLDADRSTRQQQTTSLQIELATQEQRLGSFRSQWRQLQLDQEERSGALEESRSQLADCLARLEQSRRNILSAESEVAELYLRKEQLAKEAVALVNRRETMRTQRNDILSQAQEIREQLRGGEKAVHEKELAASQWHHQRDTLAQRLQDDYQIDIRQLFERQHDAQETSEELHRREEAENEIAELRRKINNIGNVNLEALGELEGLEVRFDSLSTQFEDLTKAKNSLEQIIGRINADSRRMFAETLDTIRGHFQELFRKLFGGGHADIILDDAENVDVLECGLDIVARPPGKEPRSISLLSGGEKTLTCVALLLSIFRSRPSPFCVLDEVDAALDEANIERFISVITEFLSSTQFLVVTHSKKTMTAADTLYGVTMQESGVSKRVSVRFEDVSEDGHIRESAFQSEEAKAGDDDTQAA